MELHAPDSKDLIKALLLTCFLSLWLYWLWSRRALYRFALKHPGHFGLPVIGSFTVIKDFKEILHALNILFTSCKSYTIVIWLGLKPCLSSAEPEFIEKVLSSSELLNKAENSYGPLFEAFQGGIVSSPASVWKHNRKAINPAFHHKVLVSFLQTFHRAKTGLCCAFDKMAEQNGEHKINKMLQRLTLGITYETTMGKKMLQYDKVDEEIINSLRLVMEKIVFHMMLSYINMGPLFKLYFKYQNSKKSYHNLVLQLLEDKFKRMEKEEKTQTELKEDDKEASITKNPNIFIDHAIENYRKQIFSYDDIVAESNNIVMGSFETTANTLHSVLVMLATHPEVQERLFEEIVNIFPEKDFEMAYEHFEQLPYLDMIINETLRLAPAIPLIGRQVVRNTQLSKDLTLPKGLEIGLSIYHVHRRKDIWGPNANCFDPDHFLPENMAGRHPYAFIPFSKGARNCIGWRYALFSLKVLLAGVVRNYRFTTSTKYEDIKFTYHVALKFSNEPGLKIHRRAK